MKKEIINKIKWGEWIDGFLNLFSLDIKPQNKYFRKISYKLNQKLNWLIEKAFNLLDVAHYTSDFKLEEIPIRTACFIKEARKDGFSFEILKSKYGYGNHFKIKNKNKTIYFEGLPLAKFSSNFTNNKQKTKNVLKKKGFPVPEGKQFWFFQKRKAIKYAKKLGFPLVVKPNFSSLAKGVTTNIKTKAKLKKATNEALIYSPLFLIEEYLSSVSDFRITIVNFKKIFCFQRVPAFVEGDGKNSISKLIKKENSKKERGEKRTINTPFYNIKITSDTKKVLKEQELTLSSIPRKKRKVKIQNNPFLKIGGVPVDKTDQIHPDNIKLFKKIAKKINLPLMGIDFLINDISSSHKKQQCGIIEINELPGIAGHHYPYQGKDRNVSRAILNTLQ